MIMKLLVSFVLLILFSTMMTFVNGESTLTPYDFLSPQKQLKLGIDSEEIQCNETLLLLVKYDGSPTCVTQKTHTELIKRGWSDPKSIIVFDTSMESPYFTKHQMINVDANSKVTKQLICPSVYHLLSGAIKPQDDIDIVYGMEKIQQYGNSGWQFNIENNENKMGIMKIQIVCTTDLSQYEHPPHAAENQINLSA
jgi:hypothetical protein